MILCLSHLLFPVPQVQLLLRGTLAAVAAEPPGGGKHSPSRAGRDRDRHRDRDRCSRVRTSTQHLHRACREGSKSGSFPAGCSWLGFSVSMSWCLGSC